MATLKSVLVQVCFAAAVCSAQWLNYPAKGTPRGPDGKPNLTAPVPRRADGKPDMSGVWMGITKYMINIAADVKEVPFQPWAAAEYKRRRDTESKDDPSAQCLPLSIPLRLTITSPFKIVDVPEKEEMIMLSEGARHREIFMDGRPLPKDPEPSWYGYSIGRWDGDDLVIDSIGFNGKQWLDINGHPTSDAFHLVERYRLTDATHMELEMTYYDPKAWGDKAWTGWTKSFRLDSKGDSLEENICDPAHWQDYDNVILNPITGKK